MRSWRSLLSSSGEYLSPENALELIKTYHENAGNATNRNIALEWCKNAAKLLRGMKTAVKEVHADSSSKTDGQALRDRITTAYHEHGELLESLGCHDKAEEYYRSAKKWRGRILKSGRTIPYSESSQQVSNISVSTGDSTTGSSTTAQTPMNEESHPGKSAGSSTAVTVPAHIFAVDKRPPVIRCTLPVAHGRITDTRQLARCLGLLKTSSMHSDDDDNEEDPLDEATRYRVIAIKEDPDEQERLRTLVTDVIKAFTHDELKDAKTVAEVMCLAPVLEKNEFRHMFKLFVQGVEHSTLLDIHLLEGLAHLMRGARRRYLQADDLVKVLNLLNTLLQKTHSQSQDHIYQLTVTVALVLDAMADSNVKDVDRQSLHEPLSNYLKDLKASSDPNVVYQAAYAYQAIQYVPDNETLWKAAWRRTTTVVDSVSGLVKAVKAFDLAGFIERLEHIQEGLASAQEILNLAKTAYDGVTTLMQSGQDFRLCLKEGLNFSRKQAWYPALRGADTLIQGGQLAQLRILVCGAPCRRDAAFQWGICQRLGDIAVNPLWDDESRRNAVEFLGEMYRNDTAWGQHVHIKQRILDILMQLAGRLDGAVLCAKSLLSELETDGYVHKKALYQASLREGKSGYPLQVALPPTVSHSLIDRVQNKVDVEADLDKLRRRRLNEPDNTTVYIPPLAKDSLQAPDDALFPLMERTKEFLSGNKKVMLILGDSGAGKSSFNRVLERELWKDYKKKEERIPLYINLPAINKPDRDLVAKQLRKARFKESQIDEMKSYRKFILICDGYDECQQTQNLFASNELNQEGEWDVQMIISCRTEYLSADYRDRFQPIDRNQKAGSSLYQEAVIAPFTKDQIHDYIKTYVSRTREPQWKKLDYIKDNVSHTYTSVDSNCMTSFWNNG
ncbi:hypothetical protein BGX28_005082 [Mortierella sp. GBA30]|nr:hypothetical protein BGX28_005082 [Mortierella sp. GBA30]